MNEKIVHLHEGKWYFWNDLKDRVGPYDNEGDCWIALGKYTDEIVGKKST